MFSVKELFVEMSSSERYEILQDDADALLERIEASLDLVKKKKNQVTIHQSLLNYPSNL